MLVGRFCLQNDRLDTLTVFLYFFLLDDLRDRQPLLVSCWIEPESDEVCFLLWAHGRRGQKRVCAIAFYFAEGVLRPWRATRSRCAAVLIIS